MEKKETKGNDNGYKEKLTPSMEDYMEMIYRLSKLSGFTRIQAIADALHVQPPSVTRMIQKLAGMGLVNYERYGLVKLTELGRIKGNRLLKRHNTIEEFLRVLGVTEYIMEETEKIEHTISKETLMCITDYLGFLEENPDVVKKYKLYRDKNRR